ncbi:MAG TPA: N-acetylglucosamine-6-phosphate deacetylase [Chloroflexota bacterium]|nr:N-acetylglucosamine-6-phosphate deacetylase [Chloroflexota bacterium]
MTAGQIRSLWGRVLTDGEELPPARVSIAEGRIVAIEPAARALPGDLVVDTGWIAPGLIDLQVNGAAGVDLTSSSDIAAVARTLAAHGVTAFCPTVVSSPCSLILDRLATYGPRAIGGGATSLGAHIEGPFLDPVHRGVHDPAVLRDASHDEIEAWLQAGQPAIVTLAPERPGGLSAIAQLVEAGVVVSLGHAGADADQAQAGINAGARMGTHLFNGMSPLHHRQPGLVGALLASDAVVGLIADGVHVHPLVIDLVVRRAGVRRVALVSDALAAASAPPGESVLGEQRVISEGHVVRRADGTLAGSAMLLDACLRNVRAWLPDVPPAEVVQMTTGTPAALLGCARKGRVVVGGDADLVILDAAFNVQLTLIGGETVA